MEFDLEKAVQVLSQTPGTVRHLLSGLSEEWTMNPDGSDDWSPFDVIGHYIHGEETDWIPRAEIILRQHDDVRFVPFDRFAQIEKSKGKSLHELINRFAGLRKLNLQTLEDMQLTESQFELKGIHPELGEVTLEQLLSAWVAHDLTHIRQIVVFLARKYQNNVGPWKEYLSILD